MNSHGKALGILLKYRWYRFVNSVERMAAYGQQKSTAPRSAPKQKTALSRFLFVVMVIGYPLMAFHYSHQVFDKMLPGLRYHLEFEDGRQVKVKGISCTKPRTTSFSAKMPEDKDFKRYKLLCVATAPALHQSIPAPVQRSVALQLALIVLAAIVSGIASREISAPEWDLEWLITLPLPLKALIDARILQRSLLNPLAIILIWPFVTIFLWQITHRIWALPLGILMALPLLFMAGCVQTMVDTGLRLLTKPSNTRSIQAFVAALFPLALIVVMSPMLAGHSLVPAAAALLPRWSQWLPFELLIAIFTSTDLGFALSRTALLIVELALLYSGCSWLLRRLLARGVVAGSGWQSSANPRRLARLGQPTPRQGAGSKLLNPIARKELALLWRDKNSLIQALFVPLLAFGTQVWLTGAGKRLLAGPLTYGVVAAFVFISYMLTLTAFQVVASEKQSLWLWHTLPRSLEDTVRRKLKLWGAVALTLFSALLALRFSVAPVEESLGRAFWQSATALIGIGVFTVIAGSIGILGCDVLADDQRKRLSFTATFALMTLSGFYTLALVTDKAHTAGVIIILAALLAAALWQKAKARLPYLLDPSSAPPPAVTIADGLLAAFGFFALQSLVVAAVAAVAAVTDSSTVTDSLGVKAIFFGFLFSGTSVCATFIWRFSRRGFAHQPRLWPQPPNGTSISLGHVFGWGVSMGLLAGAMGMGYLSVREHFGWFAAAPSSASAYDAQSWWTAAIMIVAAPVFEEYIFRGLLFGSLARSWAGRWGGRAAVLVSAAVFALLHPPLALAPVFGLGLVTAFAYQRTGSLAAPIIAHALYNAAVISYGS